MRKGDRNWSEKTEEVERQNRVKSEEKSRESRVRKWSVKVDRKIDENIGRESG